MELRWERVPRLPRPPLWAGALVGSWSLLVLGGLLLERRAGSPVETCLFHRLSGHPCPTCGSTRVVLGLARGDWGAALLLNPLVALGLTLGGLVLLVRLVTARAPRLALSPREQHALLVLGVALLLGNWAWVLRTQG